MWVDFGHNHIELYSYYYIALYKLLLTLCLPAQGFPGLRGEKGDKGERGEKVKKETLSLHIFVHNVLYIMTSYVVA